MTHYAMAHAKKKQTANRRERWEAFAAFITFAALVALAGATYGSLNRSNVYAEVQDNKELERFAGILESSSRLPRELENDEHKFTLIAPSNQAFNLAEVSFVSEKKDSPVRDKSMIRTSGGESYILGGGSYVLRTHVLPHNVPEGEVLRLPAADGSLITMSRAEAEDKSLILINGVPVRQRIVADNGIIYVVDGLIHPLPSGGAGKDVAATQ